jgi:pimeloyl-ACP methyl ester carboxylesterase
MKLIDFLSPLLLARSLVTATAAAVAAEDRAAVILVPGGFHSPTVYQKVIAELYTAGYDSIGAVSLPSVGELVGRERDIDAVRSVLHDQLRNGRNVIIVGHSYGGTVIGEAVKGLKDGQNIFSPPPPMTRIDRLRHDHLSARDPDSEHKPGRILGLVYIAGYIPYITEVEHPETRPDLKTVSPTFIRFTSDGKVWWDGDMANQPPEVTFYNDLPKSEAAFWVSKLRFSSYEALNATTTYIPYRGDFKCTYVVGKQDHAIPEAVARTFIEQSGAEFTVREGDWSHVPMLSHPDRIARLIREAAGEK